MPFSSYHSTQTALAAEEVDKQVGHLVDRAKELNVLYTEYSIRYQGMTATQTRFFGLTGADTNRRQREIVYAKFVLASILEWAPAQHHFDNNSWYGAGGPVYKADATNELCPYWEDFFVDLHEAAVLLQRIVDLQPTGVKLEGHALLEHIAGLLHTAETKAGWVKSLLDIVELSTARLHSVVNDAEIYLLWNQFCLNIGNGNDVVDTAMLFREDGESMHKYLPRPTPLTQATQTRIWFPISIDGEPWVSHAQAIAQRPAHLTHQKSMRGEYASEAYLWMLPKPTTACSSRYRCSPPCSCCSPLHMHCSPQAMCKRFRETDCVHIRAGYGVCSDKHCEVVDWTRYNLCNPIGGEAATGPDTQWVVHRLIEPWQYHNMKVADDGLKQRLAMVST